MDPLRQQLLELLAFESAHVDLEAALAALPPSARHRRASRLPHSVWEVLEHMRIAQNDIMNYTIDPKWRSPKWPQEYWPSSGIIMTEAIWRATIDAFNKDLESVRELAAREDLDLLQVIPHGEEGHTYLREILLVAQHNSYHLGQIVDIRRALGVWSPA